MGHTHRGNQHRDKYVHRIKFKGHHSQNAPINAANNCGDGRMARDVLNARQLKRDFEERGV